MPAPRRLPLLLVITLLALAFMLPSQPAHALTYTVTTLADSGAGSLREAITAANATVANDTITFSVSVSGIIGLTSALPNLANNGTLTINGARAITVTRNSVSPFRIFRVNSGANVTLNGLSITNGFASGDGGGIYNGGTLTVTDSTLSGNSATFFGGGGIYNGGTLTVTDSTLSGNSVTFFDGGGIYNSGILTVTNSTLSANTADFGGGILNNFGGTLMVTNSTLSGNTAGGAGGGIANLGGALTVTNSTLSANTADFGGGIYNSGGTLTVPNSTLSGNTATVNGGGISNGGGTLTVAGSYLFANAAVTGDGVYSANAGSVTNTCLVGNGDTAVINTNGTLTATGNWWGTSWGPNIPAAPASTGSLVSSGDSIGGTGIAASSVNVGIVNVPTDYGTYNVAPIGSWLTVAPAGCGTCTAPSGVGAPRVCIIGRP